MKLSDISDISKEGILSSVGLATKSTATERLLSGLGIFGAGVVVGAAAALLFAPKSGRGLREDIGERLSGLRNGDGVPSTSGSPKEPQAPRVST